MGAATAAALLTTRAPYRPAFVRRAKGYRVTVGAALPPPVVDKEALVVPLLAEPVVVTHDDAMAYVTAIMDLAQCLENDARKSLIYRSPSKLGAEAQNYVNEAASTDGCYGAYTLCPGPEDAPLPKSIDEGKKRLVAAQLRKDAATQFRAQKEMNDRAESRGIRNDATGNAQVTREIQFYEDVRNLEANILERYNATSAASVTGSSDWRAIQALDVKLQTLRARYTTFGFRPSCSLPDFTSSSAVPWVLLILAGLVGVVLIKVM